jgi:hypothetical protein
MTRIIDLLMQLAVQAAGFEDDLSLDRSQRF